MSKPVIFVLDIPALGVSVDPLLKRNSLATSSDLPEYFECNPAVAALKEKSPAPRSEYSMVPSRVFPDLSAGVMLQVPKAIPYETELCEPDSLDLNDPSAEV